MKKFILKIGVALLLAAIMALPTVAAEKTRVLVITGGHDFEVEPFFKLFKDNADITYKAAAHPNAVALFKADAAKDYDVIVLYDMMQKFSDEAQKDFVARLKDGKGLVAMHHCLGGHQDWPEFRKIVGGKYHMKKEVVNGAEIPGSTYKHDVEFKVKVENTKHPITKGLKDFTIHDETYGGYSVNPDVTPLLTTDEPTSSKTVAWAKTYEKARVVYIQLGHDHLAYENPSFQKLLKQSISWTAKK